MDNHFDLTSSCAGLMSAAPQESSSNSNGQHLSSLTTIPPPLYYVDQPQPLLLQYPANNIYIPQHLSYVEPPPFVEPAAANNGVDMTQGSSSVSVYIPQHLPYVEPPPLIEPFAANNGVDMTQGSSSVSVYMEPGNYCGDLLPPGYKFNPKDDELILHYLMKKVSNQPLPCNFIIDVEVYKCTPWDLVEKLMLSGDKKGFCFTPRDRLYARGQRPNRRAIDGYWKATGAEQKIRYNHRKPYRDNVYGDIVYGDIIGTKRALVFYRGRYPKGDKTQWIMHEYNLYNEDHKKGTAKDTWLDNYVLCSIYYKGKTLEGSSHHENVNESMGMLDCNHNDDNVKESSSSIQHMQEIERHLYGGSESSGVPSNSSANHIHDHNVNTLEEGLMKNS